MTLLHITHTPPTPVKKKAQPEEDSDGEFDNEEEDDQIIKTSTKELLFVHQSKDHRRLFERYGNKICMVTDRLPRRPKPAEAPRGFAFHPCLP